ncbi:hypothetical protein EXM22_09250 [Oceanispirochaeta crateris]|uniref:Methyl-accepting transducer domain-containing protein n=1 Tax=Oceanispirochaeta crateris TaxID=2518645 RepID=A0A5C1QJ34_9SPIO|nr:methyl-accepting chemotaxis protein [Oceanispirochaeta crateris]QEN08163.1 hypothetical protein EXM22_09250 [Oceanispirochaeta crateris]
MIKTLHRLLLLGIFFNIFVFSATASELLPISEWEAVSLDSMASFPESGWTPQIFPGTFKGQTTLAAFRTNMVIPSSLKGQQVVFELGRYEEGWRLYLNGVHISQEGLLYDSHTPSLKTLKFALLPEELVNFDGNNVFTIILFSDGGHFTLKNPGLNTYETLYPLAQLSDFVNIHIYAAFFLVSCFIFIYYLMRFFMNREDRSSLYFAIANLALSIYFLEMGATFPSISHQLFYKLSKAFLPIFFGSLTLFFLEYFNKFNSLVLRVVIIGISFLSSLSILVFGNTSIAVGGLFNLTLLPGALELLLMSWIATNSVIKGNRLAIPILLGVFAGIITAAVDISYVVRGIDPLFYAQGFGILLFDIAMFMSLAYESLQVARNLDRTSRDNLAKTEKLQNFLHEMGKVSEVLAQMNRGLSEHVINASKRTDLLKKENDSIALSVDDQFKHVQVNSDAINSVLENFNSVRTKLETQDGNIRDTSQITIDMLKTFENTVNDLKRTTEFVELLRDETGSAEMRLVESTRIIGDIQTKSKDITQLIDAMNDIASQTNLLAINASIEAAHAGNAGDGFAVVAQEIKKLAANSASRASDVIHTIEDISNLIQSGVESNDGVKQALSSIKDNTESALHQVSSIYGATQNEKEAGSRIISAMNSLTEFSAEIGGLTQSQTESGLEVKSGLDELVQLSQELRGSIERSVGGNSELVQLIQEIEKIAGESVEESKRLNVLLAGDK